MAPPRAEEEIITVWPGCGPAPQGTAEYADYASADGTQLLGFEKFGSTWEASLGQPLQPWELTVYPGSDGPAAGAGPAGR